MKFMLPIAAVFIWAANAVVSKLATGVIEPGAIALGADLMERLAILFQSEG